MSQQSYFTFTTPEEVIERGKFFPYWEIRDEQNRFLMSRKPKEGELIIGSADHNNDQNLSLAEAVSHFITNGKTSFKFIRVKLGTNKNATTNHSYYAINLTGENTENADLLNGFYPNIQPSPTNPNMFIMHGLGNNKQNPQQEVIPNPMNQMAEMLEVATAKLQAQYEKQTNDLLMAMERKMLATEREAFEKQKAEWESGKEEALNGAVTAATTYGLKNLMSDIPTLTGTIIDVVAAVQDLKKGQKVGTTLNGSEKKEFAKKQEKERPKVQFSKKSETKEEDSTNQAEEITATTKTETTTFSAITKNDNKENVSIFAGMDEEEIAALKEVAAGLKSKKIHPQEITQVVQKPEEFFEEEKTEEDENETK